VSKWLTRGTFLPAGAMLMFAACVATATQTQGTAENVLTCVSVDGSRRHCEAYTDAGVALRQSIGSSVCLLGRNWGYDASGVWVTEGCGAEFVLGNPSAEEQRVAAATRGTTAPTPDTPTHGAPQSLGDYRVYSRFGTQVAFTQDESQVQDASSRIGFEYSVGDEVRLFAAAEWSVRLTGNENPFNPGDTTSSGFVVLEDVQSRTFGNRLGYLGVDFNEWGRFAVGKQWGVHYDVTSYTDQFHVFGADASATFNAGTDGGFMGTGRADSALSYRNTFFDRFEIGMQIQMRNLSNGQSIDGYGASAQLRILEGFKAGASYTRAMYDDRLKGPVLGLDGDGEYLAFGLRYDSDRLKLAGVYARETNGDLTRVPVLDEGVSILLPVVFDATGVELFGRYELPGGVGLLGGYLSYDPDTDSQIGDYVDARANLEYYVAGLDYRWFPNATFFAEYRLAKGIDALGIKGDDVFAIGFQYWFNKTGSFVYP
jgi:predicted porin